MACAFQNLRRQLHRALRAGPPSRHRNRHASASDARWILLHRGDGTVVGCAQQSGVFVSCWGFFAEVDKFLWQLQSDMFLRFSAAAFIIDLYVNRSPALDIFVLWMFLSSFVVSVI